MNDVVCVWCFMNDGIGVLLAERGLDVTMWFFRPYQKGWRKPKSKRRGSKNQTGAELDIPSTNLSSSKEFVRPNSTEGRPLAFKGAIADIVNQAWTWIITNDNEWQDRLLIIANHSRDSTCIVCFWTNSWNNPALCYTVYTCGDCHEKMLKHWFSLTGPFKSW